MLLDSNLIVKTVIKYGARMRTERLQALVSKKIFKNISFKSANDSEDFCILIFFLLYIYLYIYFLSLYDILLFLS